MVGSPSSFRPGFRSGNGSGGKKVRPWDRVDSAVGSACIRPSTKRSPLTFTAVAARVVERIAFWMVVMNTGHLRTELVAGVRVANRHAGERDGYDIERKGEKEGA
jgi:hypothetical protein